MPIYKIQDETGKIIQVQMDQPPSNDDVEEILSHPAAIDVPRETAKPTTGASATIPEAPTSGLGALGDKLAAREQKIAAAPPAARPAAYFNQAVGGAGDVLQAGAESAVDLIPQRAQAAIGNVIEQPLNTLSGLLKGAVQHIGSMIPQPVQQGTGQAAQTIGTLAKEHPVATEYAKAAGNAALTFLPMKAGLQEVGNLVKKIPYEGIPQTIGSMMEAGAEKGAQMQENALATAIDKGITKGIKPTILGKQSVGRVEDFYRNAETAVKTIAENKDAIKLLDDAGETIAHPRTVAEFAKAVDQTKKIIYQKYHDMAMQAGEAGAQFNSEPIIKKLADVSKDLKFNPEVRNYAKSLQSEVSELHTQPPEVIEARIADLNSSLNGFYEGRVSKAKAQIDASVAQAMREELDNSIEKSIGEGYQGLKNQYGALKSIERDVNKRAIVEARKNVKGLPDMTDIFTNGEILGGLISMNPAIIAKGVGGRVTKEIIKKLNNPDRYINDMFKKAYNIQPTQGDKISGTSIKDLVSKAGARLGNERGAVGAYHGSRHDFNEFDASKIGTGEGAQTFGHGLYFTDKKDVAKYYADAGIEYSEKMDALKRHFKGDMGQVKTFLTDIKDGRIKNGYTPDEAAGLLEEVRPNNIYKVTLHKGKMPDQYRYLKYDEKVPEEILKKTGMIENAKKIQSNDFNSFFQDPVIYNGELLYKDLSKKLGSQKSASEYLLKNGIDGIDYPGGTISGYDSGTRNYIVFDPKAVTIESKQTGSAAVPMMGLTAAGSGAALTSGMTIKEMMDKKKRKKK